MPSNTTYNPEKVSDFTKSNISFLGQSVSGTANMSENKNSDITLTDDFLLTGGMLIVKNGSMGDRVSLQVVHPVMGVLNEFVKQWVVVEDSQKQFDLSLDYPAKIPAGLILRCNYVADSQILTREFAVNFYLHKVLV